MMKDSPRAPILLIDAVGMTTRLLKHAPRLRTLAEQGWQTMLGEVVPAVTCTAQASLLTGKLPSQHGIVANGWLYRDTMEVRFWQQSNRLLGAEPLYLTARHLAERRGERFRCAKLFWWFNQGADVEISITPKPYYGADGNKAFGITGTPEGLSDRLERKLGRFPFQNFWGPMAGLPVTKWIADCAAEVLGSEQPNLTLVYLPHLDYDPQRHGPEGCDMPRCVRELDDACEPLLDTAKAIGARVWVVSEYGHCQVEQPIYPNRLLREKGFLDVRHGPFGEVLDTFSSRAFAVCDHQVCHVYIKNPQDIPALEELLGAEPGIDRVHVGEGRQEIGLDHPRSGELVLLSEPSRWFAYPYWLDDLLAPDFARTIDIHRKCGFDPCEMFFDPRLLWPKGRVLWQLLKKKLGFRTLMDVVPLDARVVHGSHGLPAADPLDRPILIADGPPIQAKGGIRLTEVHRLLLEALFP